MLSRKNYVREALMTAALFGSISAAFAQTPPASPADKSGDIQSAQSPQVPGHRGVEEPSANQAPAPAQGVFVDGKLNVPNAPSDTSTVPAKFSANNARLDNLPIMARGPALTDAQRKLILDRVLASGAPAASAPSNAGPTSYLPASTAMQPWPDDIMSQVPELRDTKYVILPGKVLVVRPDNWTVVEEIKR
jgi:hypothetical protein